ERTIALVTFGIYVKRIPSPDYPWAPTPEAREKWLRQLEEEWGGVVDLDVLAPGLVDDPAFRRWWSMYLRLSASPSAAVALGRMNTQIDVTPILPSVRVPTLVMHRTGDRDIRIEEARYIAQHVPGARLVELPGDDHLPWTPDMDLALDEVERFLTGSIRLPEPDRVLATVLFTDIVDSTARAAALGDRGWRQTLQTHRDAVRRELERFRGREVRTTGDGFLATFDGPARAIRCAFAIREAARRGGLEVRAGLHTGECETMPDDIGGIAVHIASRVVTEANPGEVLVSRTVKDLVAGSGIAFEDRGTRSLKGLDADWELFAAVA
ncbi:MAG TPA: adenylate/guanylate cyclase domain-containing protein, partial [Gemmatimonadota bacterium]|nr:adenylate/guanylate cyclase domain-containing protein [Gemmatimonadota bacterium]